MVRADSPNFVRKYGARLSIKDFYEIVCAAWRTRSRVIELQADLKKQMARLEVAEAKLLKR